jgi:hypothetical protein
MFLGNEGRGRWGEGRGGRGRGLQYLPNHYRGANTSIYLLPKKRYLLLGRYVDVIPFLTKNV